MMRTVTRMLIAAVVATTGALAGAGTAQASAGLAAASAAATSAPTTSIEGRASTLRFVPKSLTAASVAGTCSSTNVSFRIVNTTRRTQQVEYKGAAFGPPIPPANTLLVCASRPLKGTFTLLANPLAKLHFTIT